MITYGLSDLGFSTINKGSHWSLYHDKNVMENLD